ncbi:MAG: hypothetical protein ACHQ4F_15065 [Candidatus Dormibacteria bacterium]
MPSPPAPEPLNHRHRDTLRHIFTHPVSHNIEWPDVLSLLEAVGSVEVRRDGKYVVKVGDALEILERPKGKDVDVDEIVELRRVLRNAGYEASSPSP